MRVSTLIRSPRLMNRGTWTTRPVTVVAGLTDVPQTALAGVVIGAVTAYIRDCILESMSAQAT